jgi:hypothetical protein
LRLNKVFFFLPHSISALYPNKFKGARGRIGRASFAYERALHPGFSANTGAMADWGRCMVGTEEFDADDLRGFYIYTIGV